MSKRKLPDNVLFRRYNSVAAREIRDVVEKIYVDSYIKAIASGDPFDSVGEFMRRFDAYTSRNDYDLVIAYDGDEPVGQSWGWPLDKKASKGWWAGLLTDPGPDFTREDGRRTFALSEIMVREKFAGQHIAHALHDELLSTRPEQRATLLVEPDNKSAYRAYLHWGWRKVAELRPGWPDAPLFHVLVLDLPLVLSK